MTRYLLDANVFIQAKNLHYGLDFCPAFWTHAPRARMPVRMLIGFTILWLCLYVPLETYASIAGGGVFTFGYLIDVVGMALMAAGVVAARRTPPKYDALAAGWAWTSANFWRGTMERYWSVDQGRSLQFGSGELVVGPILTALALAALAATLWRARG